MHTGVHACACHFVLLVLLPLTSRAADVLTSLHNDDGETTSEGSTATVTPPEWTRDAALNEVLTAVVDGYADVVDPERVAEDMRWMHELLGK